MRRPPKAFSDRPPTHVLARKLTRPRHSSRQHVKLAPKAWPRRRIVTSGAARCAKELGKGETENCAPRAIPLCGVGHHAGSDVDDCRRRQLGLASREGCRNDLTSLDTGKCVPKGNHCLTNQLPSTGIGVSRAAGGGWPFRWRWLLCVCTRRLSATGRSWLRKVWEFFGRSVPPWFRPVPSHWFFPGPTGISSNRPLCIAIMVIGTLLVVGQWAEPRCWMQGWRARVGAAILALSVSLPTSMLMLVASAD